MVLKELSIFCDYKMDESYTPSKLSVRVGTSFCDLREVKVVDLKEPQGWVTVPLAPDANPRWGGARGCGAPGQQRLCAQCTARRVCPM